MVYTEDDKKRCPVCKGQGTEPAREPGGGIGAATCTHCGGSGYVEKLGSKNNIDVSNNHSESSTSSYILLICPECDWVDGTFVQEDTSVVWCEDCGTDIPFK